MAKLTNDKAKAGRARYMREYRRKNKEQQERYENEYWARKYEEYKEQDRQNKNG